MSVTFAGRILRRLGIAGRGHYPNSKGRSAITSGPALIAGTPQKSDGPGQLNIKARALRIYNRDAKKASIYERKHIILSEGRK